MSNPNNAAKIQKVKCPICGISVEMPADWDGKDAKESLCNRCYEIDEVLSGEHYVTFSNGKTWPIIDGRVQAVVDMHLDTIIDGERESFLDALEDECGGIMMSDISFEIISALSGNMCRIKFSADVSDGIYEDWGDGVGEATSVAPLVNASVTAVFSNDEIVTLLEVARVGLADADTFDNIADSLDMEDEALQGLRDKLGKYLDENGTVNNAQSNGDSGAWPVVAKVFRDDEDRNGTIVLVRSNEEMLWLEAAVDEYREDVWHEENLDHFLMERNFNTPSVRTIG